MWWIEIVVMVVMILFNAGLAAFEIALASISVSRLQSLAHDGARRAQAALAMKQSMEGSLAVVQLGITLAGAIAAATAGAGAQEGIAPSLQSGLGLSETAAEVLSVVFVVIPLTVATIIFGELIPKVFALRNPEKVLLLLSPTMQWFAFLAWPIVWVLETSVQLLLEWIERLSRHAVGKSERAESTELQELRASAAIARTSRLIGKRQEQIIIGAAELSQTPVRDIMLPAEFISLLNVDSSAGDALIVAHMDMHTRFPVTERPQDPQGIIGYVMFKDIVAHMRFSPQDNSLRSIVRQISSYDSQTPIARVLELLIREHSHIALVRDDQGEVVGMVTMEDMLEELVGDIEDEYDRLPAQVVATGRGWIVGGGATLAAVKKQTGIDLADPELPKDRRTLSVWITDQLGGPVRGSEVIETPTVRVLVRKSRRHKVMEAYLSPKADMR
ncbi:hemolysin family protein [Planctomicrobium piriforme]|uniref:Putative hemolysin n=1 Tax=Planctomicrobium piriforme TaxID=1576369 RepID=A0A1I3L754_9PLAN|nr:hemolysin family protein [Planctomicrobium piriforme]SFI80498.1 putative hemolysin [Planctomicrobium piriforme]